MIENWALFVLGLAVIAATLIDLAWTAIAVAAGTGPISKVGSRTCWRTVTAGNSSGRRRQLGGYATVVVLPLTWVGLMLAGYSTM